MGDIDLWGLLIGFSEALSEPLANHLGDVEVDEASGLRSVLVSLLTEGPRLSQAQATRVVLETVRQSAGLISGEVEHPATERFRRSLGADSPESIASTRRGMAVGVLREIRRACEEACQQRPSLQIPEVLDLLEACLLPLIHTKSSRETHPSLVVLGAELGVEVDGTLLEEVRFAVEVCYQRVRQENSDMGRRLAQSHSDEELYFAGLSPEECEGLLSCMQDKVRVRDLTNRGVDRVRAKRLLKMQSTAVLFSVFRQLHLQVKRFDLLVGICARLVPVTKGSQGAYSPFGRLPDSIRWAFLGPGSSHSPTRCSVVIVGLSGLIREASRRTTRDKSTAAMSALWASWEALSLEAESLGGVALVQGTQGIGLFARDEQAQAFAKAIRKRFQVPIELTEPGTRNPIVLPPVDVPLRSERGPVYGFMTAEVMTVWGEIFESPSAPVSSESAPQGFSILTEIGEDEDTEVHAEETFISEDGSSFYDSVRSDDPSSDTLDAFFLPTKTEYGRRVASGVLDLGIDADALVEILSGYGAYRHANGEWSFGVLTGAALCDHHRVLGVGSLTKATCSWVLKKYGEGFAPRSDATLDLKDPGEVKTLSEELLRDAYRELTVASG